MEKLATCGERAERQYDQEASTIAARGENRGQGHAGVEYDGPHGATLYARVANLVVAFERRLHVGIADGRVALVQHADLLIEPVGPR